MTKVTSAFVTRVVLLYTVTVLVPLPPTPAMIRTPLKLFASPQSTLRIRRLLLERRRLRGNMDPPGEDVADDEAPVAVGV